MSDFSLTLVLQIKTSKFINGMAKVSIKSEKITPFGGIFQVREEFSRFVGPVIDKVLGLRCTSFGYQYSEIVGSLSSVYFCGGDCVEDVTSHLMPHLSLHPTLRTCSSDTILRVISELATGNTTYTTCRHTNSDVQPTPRLNSNSRGQVVWNKWNQLQATFLQTIPEGGRHRKPRQVDGRPLSNNEYGEKLNIQGSTGKRGNS